MNHKRSSLLSGSYVALTKAFEPGNECASTILSAPLGDGCVGASIVARERAGTHHRLPRVSRRADCRGGSSAGTVMAFARNPTCNSPARHSISSRVVLSVCVPRPVSGSVFTDSAVRVLMWNGYAGRALVKGRGVFMPPSSIFFGLAGYTNGFNNHGAV